MGEMNHKRCPGFLILLLSISTVFWACSGLRTEVFREETAYRYHQACQLYEQGDYPAARSGFEAVIGIDAHYGPAHAALGHLALIGEDYPGALAHYWAAVATDKRLEGELRPLLMEAAARTEREPLRKAGVRLDRLVALIMADDRVGAEALLAREVPLQLLAADTLGITPGTLGELQRKIVGMADPDCGSTRYRLFLGYLLFSGGTDDALAALMIGSAAEHATGRDRQEALVVLGRLHERRGAANAAVNAYLAAVEAGLPMAGVAHHLARVYGVAVACVLPSIPDSAVPSVPTQPAGVAMTTCLPRPPAPDLGPLAEPKVIPVAERRLSPYSF